jgi:hypothetical protein
MFTRLVFLLGIVSQAMSLSLRSQNPMTTVIPKPHVTILPTDIYYEPIPRNAVLYHPEPHYLR